jgi:DNA-binding MarR family transcriptional regulator
MEPTRIAEDACLLLPSLTRILQKLEEKQLIRREPDPEDRRKQIVWIDRQGRLLIRQNKAESIRLMAEVRQRMGPARYDLLLDLLNELDARQS